MDWFDSCLEFNCGFSRIVTVFDFAGLTSRAGGRTTKLKTFLKTVLKVSCCQGLCRKLYNSNLKEGCQKTKYAMSPQKLMKMCFQGPACMAVRLGEGHEGE